MGLSIHWLWETARFPARNRCAAVCLIVSLCTAFVSGAAAGLGQFPTKRPDHAVRARRFLAGRTGVERQSSARLEAARRQHAAMLMQPRDTALSANWHAVGPARIASLNYGNVTGRVTSVAIDPADVTGNTVYLGTTGGGVWKSVNAAGNAAGGSGSVTFAPLTDTLSVFNSGSAVASLSIGAVSVANGIVLAGTGDPNDALDSYYGSGILRSSDGGTTWTLAQQSNDGPAGPHLFTGLGFAGFAWSGTAPTTVVAAVSDAAEGELVGAVDEEYSTRGLYFSNDAGVTWQMATVMDGAQVVQSPQPNGLNHGGSAATAVVWNPVRQRFYAAVRFHGYYESTDGTVWTRLAAQPGTGLTQGACPSNTNQQGSVVCPVFRGALAVEPASGDMYAFTVDAGLLDQGIWRDACNASGGACAGTVAFGTKLDSTPLEAGFGSTEIYQGDYDLSLAAVASGAQTELFAGTVDLYRCVFTTAAAGAAGCEFRNTTNVFNGCAAPAMVASAQHAIAVLAGEGPLVYLGNDGGVWRSTDGVAETGTPCSASDTGHFQNLNGGLGSLAEVVSFAQNPTDVGTLIVGVGANGTAATSTAATDAPWAQLAAGEGGFAAIDQVNPQNWYLSTGPGVNIAYCGNGPQCEAADFAGIPAIGEPQVDEDASVIDAPWILDPGDTANVVIGTCRVWRGPAADGSSWPGGNAISAEFGVASSTPCGAGDSFVRSIAAGGAVSSIATGPHAGSKVIYAGMAGVLDGGGTLGGHVFATTAADKATGATAWTDLALNPVTNDAANGGVFNPGGFDVSSLTVDPHDATGATVYATVMGFGGNGLVVPRVYRSTDGGAHWLNISSNLPNAPANVLVVDPNAAETVYVALDTGVYATTAVSTCATADCWTVFGSGLPNAPVVALQAGAQIPDGFGNAGELRAGTYGRGIWQIPLLSAVPSTTAALSLTPGALNFAAEAVGTVSAAQTETVTNTGSAIVVVSSVVSTGDFAETDNCAGNTLAVGGSCTVNVTFAATALGSRAGTLTVVYEKAGQQAQLQAVTTLTGTGETPAAVALNPLALNFGSVVTGSTSPIQSVTVANKGGVAAALGALTMTGDFGIAANGCGGTLAPGTQCSVGIVFAPTAAGTRNGTFSVASSNGTQTASLTGVGASVATDTVSPGALNFGQQQKNTTSAAQTATLTNSGDTALTGIAVSVSGAGFALTNGCGNTLAGHAACSIAVRFTPGSVGTLTGSVTVTDELRTQTVLLSGVGYPPPVESVTPGSLSFSAMAVGVTSAVQQLTVTNTGGGVLALGAVTVTGDFSEADSCTGAMLGAGIHCAVNVTFTPTALGTRTGTLTVAGAAPGTGVTVALTGVGATVAAIGISPASINFGTVTVGQQSGTQTITVSNTGGLTGTLGTATISGDFEIQSNFCGSNLPAGAQCLVGVVFAPTASGTRTGTFAIAGTSGPTMGGTVTASLSGSGLAPATDTLSPLSLTFAPQQVGTASGGQTVTVTNSGDATLTGLQASASPASFTLTNGCATSLAGHSQCVMKIVFDPLVTGAIAGTLKIQDQSRPQAQSVSLSGTGLAPAMIVLTPGSVSFGSVVVGTTTAAQNVTVSNTGGVAAALQALTVTGDFKIAANTCGASLAPGTGCTAAVEFSPTAAGARNGRLAISDSVGTQTATLSGTGLAPATDGLSPLSLSFGQQVYGTVSAAQTVTLTNTGDAALTPIAAAIVSGSFTVANNCGGSLAGHSSCTLAVAFAPPSAGPMTGVLTVTDPLRTQSVALTGTGVGPPLLAVTPSGLAFMATGVGQSSAAQAVTVSNAAGGTLTLGKLSVTGDFAKTDNCPGAGLAAGATCAVQVVFSPTATGTRTGTLTVTGSAGSGAATQSVTIGLTGLGAAPAALALSPASLSFGSVTVATTSAAQNIAVSNTGGAPATLGAASATGDFAVTANTCGTTLAAGMGCTVAVVFTPTASGARTGVLSIAGSAGSQVLSQTAALSGTGLSAPTDTLSPMALSFGSQQYGTSSLPQVVTLTNSGDEALTLIAAQIAGGSFALTNTCGPTLAGHSSCTLSVVFSPIAGGTLTGTLTVADALRTQTVALSGVGIAPPLAGVSPAALSFPATVTGQTSAAQTVTVTNTGGGALIVSSVTVTGDFGDTESCTRVSLAAGVSCAVQVVFSPTATGTLTGTLTLKGNMPGGQATAALSGMGATPAAIVLTPSSLNFGTVTVGASANPVLNIAVSNTGGVSATLGTATVTGDFSIAANTCGTTLAAGRGCTVAIGFTPTTAGTRTGTFSIADSVGTQTAALIGMGAAAATDSLSPLALSFAVQPVGTASAAQTVTLTNTGDNALTLVSAQITKGEFVAASACGNALPGHSSCTIAVTYAPKTTGEATGVLTVSDQFRSQTVALSGTGIAAPGFSISPGSLAFAATGVTTVSSAQTLTVTNNGTAVLAISGIEATGDFSLPAAANTCGATVAVGGSCSVQVVFAPTAGGTRTGSVSFADNAPGSPQMVTLSGVGVDFTLASDGPSSVTVTSGASASYALLLSSAAGIPGTATFVCTGIPANSICTVSPGSAALGTSTVMTVTVETGVSATGERRGISQSVLWAAALFGMGWFGRRRGYRGRGLVLFALVLMAGCGSGRVVPPPCVGCGGGGGGGVTTPSGTYAISVAATSAGLTRTVGLTLVVQ